MSRGSQKRLAPGQFNEYAEREVQQFMKRYDSLAERRFDVSLSVLIWGKSPKSRSRIARKRKQIRQKLRELGHNAMFSEDIEDAGIDVSQRTKEFAQALAADLIIILPQDSPGAWAEFHDFFSCHAVAKKMYLMIPRECKETYAGNGAIRDFEVFYKRVYWYAEEELDVCTVLTEAVKWVEAGRTLPRYYSRTYEQAR